MIHSEILKEKYRIQAQLSEESTSIHEYLLRSNFAAKEVAELYGFSLQYAKLPNKLLQQTLVPQAVVLGR